MALAASGDSFDGAFSGCDFFVRFLVGFVMTSTTTVGFSDPVLKSIREIIAQSFHANGVSSLRGRGLRRSFC
mgnify:CR=1 FL=1|jgi:hypothetical protein